MREHYLSAIRVSKPLVELASVEAIKYIALALMLFDHVYRYVLHSMPWPAYVAGRLVFPLFIICFAVAVHNKSQTGFGYVVLKLVPWAIVASFLSLLVRDALPLNVLWTFILGVLAHGYLQNRTLPALIACACCIGAGIYTEFGPGGVAAIPLAIAWARDQRSPRGMAALVVALALVCWWDRDLLPLLSLPVAMAVSYMRFEVPRTAGTFAACYAIQFPALLLVRAVI